MAEHQITLGSAAYEALCGLLCDPGLAAGGAATRMERGGLAAAIPQQLQAPRDAHTTEIFDAAERERFERRAREEGYETTADDVDGYADADTHKAWIMWRAAIGPTAQEHTVNATEREPKHLPPLSEPCEGLVLPPFNLKQLRRDLALKQDEFAIRYGIPIAALRNWEQRRRKPDKMANLLLHHGDSPKILEDAIDRLRSTATQDE